MLDQNLVNIYTTLAKNDYLKNPINLDEVDEDALADILAETIARIRCGVEAGEAMGDDVEEDKAILEIVTAMMNLYLGRNEDDDEED
jgi:hypothetical protein